MKFSYMLKNERMADVEADMKLGTVRVTNYTDDLLNRPFGRTERPTLADLENFLESRCFPKTRGNCKQLLESLGLEQSRLRIPANAAIR